MPDEKKPEGKTERVVFGKDATAEQILDGIEAAQDAWAKKYPEKAHRLYPKTYDAQGKRIAED